MKRIGLVLGLTLVFLSASSVGVGPDPAPPETTLPLTSPATSTTTTIGVPATTNTTPPPASTTTIADEPQGLITPFGVPVAILARDGDSYRVVTPCGEETVVTGGTPIHGVDVVLDPGHGGPVDTGAVATTGLAEKDLNLDVAVAVQQLLTSRGISVVMTRIGDYTSPLGVRADFADALNAKLMVSIHHNAPTPGPSPVPGIEVFIQDGSADSRRLGGLLWEHAMAALSLFDVAWAAASDAGVMTVLNTRGIDAYGIIRGPDTPTALIELGYISNRAEAELFAEPKYVPVAARGIADAIETYLASDAPGAGFGEGRVFNPRPGVSSDVCEDPDLGWDATKVER